MCALGETGAAGHADMMRIHVADADDAVMRLVRIALGGLQPGDGSWVKNYFSPEPGDHIAALSRLSGEAGLHGGRTASWSQGGSARELISDCPGADVLVLRRGEVTPDVLDECRTLKLIVQMGEGVGHVDPTDVARRGIQFRTIQRRSLDRTAEHVLLLMLAVARRLRSADAAVRTGSRDRTEGESYNWAGLTRVVGLADRKLGIIGLGDVGRRVVPLARAFGMTVSYTNRSGIAKDAAFDAAHGISLESMNELLRSSDFVTLHAKQAGQPVMGESEFAAMKTGSYFVNTSRGWLVDEPALMRALSEGRVIGAGLDVHRDEPRPADDPMLQFDNVVLTPHVAGGSRLELLHEIRQLLRVVGGEWR